jgi:hypothetical protein
MPVNALDPHPTIKVIFKGLIISHIVDGKPFAQIGAVKDAPCHEPKIKIVKENPDGSQEGIANTSDFNLKEAIFLDVENASTKKIRTFQRKETSSNKFDRFNEADNKNDFRLHVDLERDVYKKKPPSVDKSQIKPVFTIENAVFLTRFRTDKKLTITRKNGPSTPLGFAAKEIEAQIKLNKSNGKAILRNGNNVIMTVDASNLAQGTSFVITFDCECDVMAPVLSGAAAGNGMTDFSLSHSVVAKNLGPQAQVDIVGEPTGGGPSDPLVFCMVGNTSQPLR